MTTPDTKWGRESYAMDIVVRAFHFDSESTNQTLRCIDSILATDTSDARITVVSAPHNPRLQKELLSKRRYPGNLIFLNDNMGAVRMTNVGLIQSYLNPAPYVLFMDNDATVPAEQKDWIEVLCGYLEREPEIGAVGAMTDNPGPQNIETMPEVYTDAWADPETHEARQAGIVAVPYLRNFCTAWRKDFLRRMTKPGPIFDEQFEPGPWSDVDMCIRLRAAGAAVVIAQELFVEHAGGYTTRKVVPDADALFKQNREKFIDKHGAKAFEKMGIE